MVKPTTKKEKITLGVTITIWVVAFVLIILAVFSKGIFGENSFFSKLFGDMDESGSVSLGDKILAFLPLLLKGVIIAFIIYAAERFVRFLIPFVLRKSKRGKTVAKMLDSFIKFLAAIIIVLVFLGVIGVDTATLLASAGILGLVVGLGAQSLIADIIAGIFIVFEGDYNVGDIVVIDNWRGTVQEIGIRTTKLIDYSGNVKIVSNSAISTIVNQTKELSLAMCEVGIEYGESLERVETVIRDNLAGIRERIPAIVDGPYYRGVKALGASSVNLLIVAQCPEEDLFQTQRDLNREIKIVFDKNNINIPFQQVVVNQPSDFTDQPVTGGTRRAANDFVDEQKQASRHISEDDR